MTNTYPPYPPAQPPKKLERSRTNRVLGGVCGGIADYVNMDATLVRVLTVLVSLFTGVPVILYLIALFVIPEADPNKPPETYPPVNAGYNPNLYADPTMTDVGPPQQQTYAPATGPQAGRPFGDTNPARDDALWGRDGAPWEQQQTPAAETPAPEQTTDRSDDKPR